MGWKRWRKGKGRVGETMSCNRLIYYLTKLLVLNCELQLVQVERLLTVVMVDRTGYFKYPSATLKLCFAVFLCGRKRSNRLITVEPPEC